MLWCGIFEGALDIAFLCFPYTFKAVLSLFCWLKGRPREPVDGASEQPHDEFSTANASTRSQESLYVYESTENFLLAEQGRVNKMMASI